jgi:sorbitol-6-phosphate 2-dehydrogenase
VLLENHGLFVAAPDADACLALHGKVTEAGASWFGAGRVNPQAFDLVVEDAAGVENATLRGTLLAAGCAPALLRRDGSPVAQRFLGQPAAVDLVRHGALTPDQFVYCRTPPLVLEGEPAGWAAAARAYRERRGLDPRVVIRKAAGGTAGSVHYLAPDLTVLRAVGDVWRCAMATILRSPAAGEARFLTGEETSFLEIYAAAGKARAAGPLDLTGRIACVTGAGSGLGKGIARGIAGAGATVFALDINQGALSAAAADFPAGKFLPRAADVTSEESIAAAFRALEASLGGLDFLVNAAGIAPSHPLADFPLAAWRKALDINLTGYFLCAREAARLLLRQGAGGAIVNLTSKSGLEASKDNSAYNATKAGEIHLARGWALELGKAGIRVNCVAPGNVFKGSQIWNQEYIEACARKKGIRPEEVIPYYNSLSALGKEIEPEDVAGAVVFLLSDAARNITGQTLVVDGGQAMVR